MELKVWVDGVLRVVCGLSEDTPCQEVVIALAQAIGQTGRYVLVQKLRGTERQLLADERPLESLAKLGQLSSEVQFILRRTGPSSGSSSSGSGSKGPPPPPDRTTSLPPLPLPKYLHSAAPKRKELQKALTFNLGPSTAPHTKPKPFKKPPRDSPVLRGVSPSPELRGVSPSPELRGVSPSPELRGVSPSPELRGVSPSPGLRGMSPSPGLRGVSPSPPSSQSPSSFPPIPPPSSSSPLLPSKEDIFRQVLQQQAELRTLGEQLDSVQQEVWVWEQPPPPVLPPHLLEELDQLEEAVRRNKAELAHTGHWEVELTAEEEREELMYKEVEKLRRLLEDDAHRLSDCDSQAGQLERDLQMLQQEAQKNGLRQAQNTQDSMDTVHGELERRETQEAELRSTLSETEQDLDTAYKMLQVKSQELDELNKELRQCNLQQFIQQTGVPPNQQTDLQAETEFIQVSQLVLDTDTDSDSQHHLTAREILGDSRSLHKPLVLASRELPWR
ncbi:ras association domain-containing protein 7-like isoform X2 [Clupea harengus]|uniref:Ras association domain-containing protein 7-like isoform X2 n=1 Tax=Clupea harengus TaxID=7950 RepID=A0A6P8F8Y1_CLUHA|nr:ras association domain-containing protein 7-like isoform X2 [Clupea harengus]